MIHNITTGKFKNWNLQLKITTKILEKYNFQFENFKENWMEELHDTRIYVTSISRYLQINSNLSLFSSKINPNLIPKCYTQWYLERIISILNEKTSSYIELQT